MPIRFMIIATIALAVAPVGCSRTKPICKKAGAQYLGCVEKILGKEAAEMARSKSKAGLSACSKDEKTQKMYEVCLPQKGCQKFMDCLTNYAQKHGP